MAPSRIAFSEHAAERATRYDIAFAYVADVVLEEHPSRRTNPGSGDWQVRRGKLVVVYNWPDQADQTTARVVTLWLQE